MKWLALLVALGACTALAEDAPDGVSPEVWAQYEAGKASYDAKNYSHALEKFDACIALDSQRPRWHYNRGLALKKLKRDAEAREALLKSRALDPAYKATEISQKLAELGSAEPTRGERTGWFRGKTAQVAIPVAVIVVAIFVFARWGLTWPGKVSAPPEPPAELPDRKPAHNALVERLTALENASGHTTDPALLAAVNDASDQLRNTRGVLVRGLFSQLTQLEGPLQQAQASVERAELLFDHKLPGWREKRSDHPNCFFCARRLATPTLKTAAKIVNDGVSATVACCPPCAQNASQGSSPNLLSLGNAHWSAAREFNPATDGLKALEPMRAELLQNVRFNDAGFAGLGLSAAAIAAAGAVTLIDLDAMREAMRSSAASAAAASSASRRTSASSSYRDHS